MMKYHIHYGLNKDRRTLHASNDLYIATNSLENIVKAIVYAAEKKGSTLHTLKLTSGRKTIKKVELKITIA